MEYTLIIIYEPILLIIPFIVRGELIVMEFMWQI